VKFVAPLYMKFVTDSCLICDFFICESSVWLGDGIRDSIYRQCDFFTCEVRDAFMSDVCLIHMCIILRLMASNSVWDSFICEVRGSLIYKVRDWFMSDLWLLHICIILRLMAPRSVFFECVKFVTHLRVFHIGHYIQTYTKMAQQTWMKKKREWVTNSTCERVKESHTAHI